MSVKKYTLRAGDTAYIRLPGHPEQTCGCVAKTVQVDNLIPDLKGPRVILDFDADGVLIGIEILVSVNPVHEAPDLVDK